MLLFTLMKYNRGNMDNLAKYKEKHPRIIEMLEEMKDRIPWQRQMTESLLHWIIKRGDLSEKQTALVVSLYADSCVRSDSNIKAQVECRKLCYRLMKTQLGKMNGFVLSVLDHTNTYPLSPAQMKAIQKVAKRKETELEDVPDLTGDNFDGWTNRGRWAQATGLDR